MPKIPFQISDATIPGTAGGVFAPMDDPIGPAIARAGHPIQSAADTWGTFLIREKNAERALQVKLVQNNLDSAKDVFIDSYKGMTDYKGLFDDQGNPTGKLKADIDQAVNDSMKDVNDGKVLSAVKPYADGVARRLANVVRVKKQDLMSKEAADALMISYERDTRNAAMETTPEGRKLIEDKWASEARMMYSTGLLRVSPEKQIQKFKEDTAQQYYMSMKDTDPIGAYNELKGYGSRADGSTKGAGFLGEVQRSDGKVSTEISIGVEINGKEVQIPTLVPTLTDSEVKTLTSLNQGEKIPQEIIDKAVSHAKQRISAGKSPFAEKSEIKSTSLADDLDPKVRQQLLISMAPLMKEQKVNAIYTTVVQETAGDRVKAMEVMAQPNALKRFGIDIDDQNKVIAAIDRDLRVQEAGYQRFANEKIGALSNKIYANQGVSVKEMEGLREEDKATLARVQDYQVRQNRAERNAARSLASQERSERRMAQQSRSEAIMGSMINKMLKGEPVDNMTIYGAVPKGLNLQDANQLSAIADKINAMPKTTKEAMKSGIDLMTSILVSPGMNSPTQKERLNQAIRMYETGIDQYKDQLNTPDKIRDYVQQIIPRFSNFNPMDDMKNDMKRMRGVGIGNAQSGAPQKHPVVIDGKSYNDGDVITKGGKQFRVRVN